MRRLRLANILVALVAAAVLPLDAAADPPEKRSFDFSSTVTVTDLCSFPVDVTSAISGHVLRFVDSSGTLIRVDAHVTAHDTFAANGISLTGEVYRVNNVFELDENGEFTTAKSRGIGGKIRLPSGTLFLTAGIIDFIAQATDFSVTADHGRTGDIKALCAALSP